MKTKGISDQARQLHSALMQRGIEAEIEKFDGHKHIDIAIVSAKLNIEIDGDGHYTNPDIIESDLRREYYSEEKGYDTIRVPNSIVENNLNEVAEAIAEVSKRRLKS